MADLKLVFPAMAGRFEEAVEQLNRPVKAAAMAAIRAAGELVKTRGRADISQALSPRAANALRVNIYPKRGASTDPAAYIFSRIPYAGIFETGGHISPKGRQFLWLPTANAPKKIGRERISPALYIARIGPLRFVHRIGHKPLLFADVRVGARTARSGRQKFALATLRRGAVRRGSPRGKGVMVSIAMFVGLTGVEIHKRTHIVRICREARDQLPALYAANFKDE